jgi:hypothetical protein
MIEQKRKILLEVTQKRSQQMDKWKRISKENTEPQNI